MMIRNARSLAGLPTPCEARIVKLKVPAVVGVPATTPTGERVSPGGVDPETIEKTKGPEPPFMLIVWE